VTASSAPASSAQPSYKDTLNLLQTPFSMRANAKVREPEIQAFWAELQLYERLSQHNPGESFTLHDGPPYANGALHVGHALNKILKDIINKTALLQGKRARFLPGWDCHGLPIELKVLQGLSSGERAELTPVSLRKKAHAYALEQVEGQKAGFRRWGIWADWDQPYLTLQKSYEAAQIGVFGAIGAGRPHLPGSEAGALEPQLPHSPGGSRARIPRRSHLPQHLCGLPGGAAASRPGRTAERCGVEP